MEQGAWERSPLGKILRLMGTGERFATDVFLKSDLLSDEQRTKLPQGDRYMGDVLRAVLDEDPTQDSLGEKIGYGVGGFLAGGVVDPLSYLGVGLPFKAARGVGAATKAARPLLSIANPVTGNAVARLSPQILDRAVSRAGTAMHSGHVLEKTMGALPLSPGPKQQAQEMARTVDRVGTQLLQAFNVDIGADPGVFRLMRKYHAGLIGRRSEAVRETSDDMAPIINEMSQYIQETWGHDPEKSKAILQKVWLDNMAVDLPSLIDDAERRVGMRLFPGTKPSYSRNKERAAAAVIKNLGLPPTWGGPDAFFDSPLVRQLRFERRTQRLRARQQLDMANAELDHFNWGMWSHPNVTYVPNYLSDKASSLLEDRVKEIISVKSPTRAGEAGLPSTFSVHEKMAHFRYLDPQVMQQLMAHPEVTKDPRIVKLFQRELQGNRSYPYLSNGFAKVMGSLYGKDKALDQLLLTATRKMGPHEINNVIKTNGWFVKIGKNTHQLIKPGEVESAFVTDPLALMTMRSASTKRQLLSNEFFDEMKMKGLAVDPTKGTPVPAGWRSIENIPELAGHYFDPDAARWLNSMSSVEQNLPHHMKKFLEVYEPALAWWKAWTLSIFGVTHTRNFVGGMWNWYVHGGDTVEAAKAMKDVGGWWLQRQKGDKTTRFLNGINVSQLPKGVNPDMNSLFKAARRDGLLDDVGFVTSGSRRERSLEASLREYERFGDPEDLVRNLWGKSSKDPIADLKKTMKGAGQSWLTPGRENKFVTTGFRIAANVDNNIRMSTLVQRLRMGDDWDSAVAWVKKTQFDYHDLSPIEKKLFANVFPFYTWSRKNIPAQLEALIKNPDRIARLNGAMQGFEGSNAPQEEVFLNQWMRDNFPLRIQKGKDGQHRYLVMRNWLPLADIGELFNLYDTALDQATPIGKLPIEMMFNINSFTRYKIDRLINHPSEGFSGKGERDLLFGQRVPNYWAHVMKSARPINVMHDWVDNPQELTIAEMFAKHMVGRFYPFQVDRGMRELQFDLENWRKEFQRSARSAARSGASQEEMQRLVARYQDLHQRELKTRGITQ